MVERPFDEVLDARADALGDPLHQNAVIVPAYALAPPQAGVVELESVEQAGRRNSGARRHVDQGLHATGPHFM